MNGGGQSTSQGAGEKESSEVTHSVKDVKQRPIVKQEMVCNGPRLRARRLTRFQQPLGGPPSSWADKASARTTETVTHKRRANAKTLVTLSNRHRAREICA
jgi:hypothetical protein